MAGPGRIVCGPMNTRLVADAITINVGEEKRAKQWFPYSQMDARKRPVWAELWRQRGAAADFFVASNGFLLKQKEMERTVLISMAELKIPEDQHAEAEGVAMRIRAIMAHLRNAKVHSHSIPSRFQQLHAVLQMVSLENPPRTSPSKKMEKRW